MEIIEVKIKFRCDECDKITISKGPYCEGDPIVLTCKHCDSEDYF